MKSMQRSWLDFNKIKEASSWGPVLAHYGVQWQQKGSELITLCPFHEEKRGSFRANNENENKPFRCWGCDAKGNIYNFVAMKEGWHLSQRGALPKVATMVAGWCGLRLDDFVRPRGSQRPSRTDRVAESAGAAAVKEAEAPTAKGDDAGGAERPANAQDSAGEANKPLPFTLKLDPQHPYLAERGVSAATIETFGLGFCAKGLQKGRIAIPVHNAQGELVAYAGRWPGEDVPEGEGKYKLPPAFKKSLVVFNLHRVLRFRTEGASRLAVYVLVVEGFWSVFRLHQLGYPYVVALMGKELSPAQEALLVQHAERVVVMLDGDAPGRKAQEEIVNRLARRVWVRAIELPEGTQPDTVSQEDLRRLLGGV